MDAIDQLKEILSQRSIPFSVEGSLITVKASQPTGFDVSLDEGKEETTVIFEGWHEHFSSHEEAIKCFLFGLSPKCRIRVKERGGKAYQWTLEAQEGEIWTSDATTGLLLFPFWRSAKTSY